MEIEQELKRLRRVEEMYKLFRSIDPDLPRHTTEVLVKAAYELCEISIGRAAEILREPLQVTRERGWYQDRYKPRIVELSNFVSGIAVCTTPGMAGWAAAARKLLSDMEHRYGQCDSEETCASDGPTAEPSGGCVPDVGRSCV